MTKSRLLTTPRLLLSLLLAWPLLASAQVPTPEPGRAVTGHTHLFVEDLERHRDIWTALGAEPRMAGEYEIYMLPGMFILLAERPPTAPSVDTSVNHLGFTIDSFEDYKARLRELDLAIVTDRPDRGQLVVDLPGGARVELVENPEQAAPIVFHHYHLAVADREDIRDWYLEVFGADAGERHGAPSAVVPGGRVDFMQPPREDLAGTTGSAIDHIGFEVDDMDAFAARLEELGIEFSFPPTHAEAIGLTIAFITDPAGTSIEISEGLADID